MCFAEVMSLWLPDGCRGQRPERGGVAVPQAGGRAAEWRWRTVGGFETPGEVREPVPQQS